MSRKQPKQRCGPRISEPSPKASKNRSEVTKPHTQSTKPTTQSPGEKVCCIQTQRHPFERSDSSGSTWLTAFVLRVFAEVHQTGLVAVDTGRTTRPESATSTPAFGLPRSPSSALLPFLFWGRGFFTKLDYGEKLVPTCSNLSTGGPRYLAVAQETGIPKMGCPGKWKHGPKPA